MLQTVQKMMLKLLILTVLNQWTSTFMLKEKMMIKIENYLSLMNLMSWDVGSISKTMSLWFQSLYSKEHSLINMMHQKSNKLKKIVLI